MCCFFVVGWRWVGLALGLVGVGLGWVWVVGLGWIEFDWVWLGLVGFGLGLGWFVGWLIVLFAFVLFVRSIAFFVRLHCLFSCLFSRRFVGCLVQFLFVLFTCLSLCLVFFACLFASLIFLFVGCCRALYYVRQPPQPPTMITSLLLLFMNMVDTHICTRQRGISLHVWLIGSDWLSLIGSVWLA